MIFRMLVLALAVLAVQVPLTTSAEPFPSPGVEIVATGCSPCSTGDRATFVLEIVNPGPARGVAVVAVLRGGGVVYPLLSTSMLLPSGASVHPLADFTVPGGTPGVFLVEGAVLDPATGVTLSRDVLGVMRE